MNLRRRRTTTNVTVSMVIAILFGVGLFLVGSFTNTQAQSADDTGRLMTVYDRGEEFAFLSDAATVGEALEEAGFTLDPRDAVEPGVDEALVATDYRINIYRARPIIVVDNLTRQRIMTPYQTAERIAADAGITLYPEDITTLERSDDILSDGAGLQLTIDRAVAFELDLFGKKISMRTQGDTVAEMLAEKGVTLGDADRSLPSGDAPVVAGMSVRVWREGKQTITVEEQTPFETERIEDADRPMSYKVVKTPGKNGVRSVTYEIQIEDGVEVSRTEIVSIVVAEPQKQVEVVGKKVNFITSMSADKVAIMTAGGVAPADQQYAAYIINNENALWCAMRWQGTRGCAETYYENFPGAEGSSGIGYGLCQATPGNKMATAGADWRTNVVTQMKWCHQYAMSRYGSWEAAYNAKVAKGWW